VVWRRDRRSGADARERRAGRERAHQRSPVSSYPLFVLVWIVTSHTRSASQRS
jgi:hypothetical protein